MKIAQLLSPKNTLAEVHGTNWQEVLGEMVDFLAMGNPVVADKKSSLLEGLLERESQISTGIGHGVAVPHCYLPDIEELIVAFARSSQGVDFDSCDHAPVHFILMLLVPSSQRNEHLQTLADIGRLFSNCKVRDALRKAESLDEITAILANPTP